MDTPTTVMNACAQWLQQSFEEALAVYAERMVWAICSPTCSSTVVHKAAHCAPKHPYPSSVSFESTWWSVATCMAAVTFIELLKV